MTGWRMVEDAAAPARQDAGWARALLTVVVSSSARSTAAIKCMICFSTPLEGLERQRASSLERKRKKKKETNQRLCPRVAATLPSLFVRLPFCFFPFLRPSLPSFAPPATSAVECTNESIDVSLRFSPSPLHIATRTLAHSHTHTTRRTGGRCCCTAVTAPSSPIESRPVTSSRCAALPSFASQSC